MTDEPPRALPRQGRGPAAESEPQPGAGSRLDYADFEKFYDHYMPRVLAFARRGTADMAAAELLTEAILAEALVAGTPLTPGRAADAALLAAARRVGVRDETGTKPRSSRENR
jgi:DNA-directed RNA polymerase specialized sigma24 family protein